MNADGCSEQPCPPEEEIRTVRWFVGTLVSLVFLLAYLSLSFRPVAPELDWLLARFFQGLVGLLSNMVCFYDANGDVGGGFMQVFELGKWALSKFNGLGAS